MNFYKTSFVFFILSLPLLGLDCGTKDPEPVYYLPQEFKDYVVFPVGSYWIFSSSMGSDTFDLYDKTVKIIENDEDVGFPYEKVILKFSSTFFLDSIYGGSSNIYLSQNIDAYGEFFRSAFMSGNTTFFHGRDTGFVLQYNQNIRTTYKRYYDSLQVQGSWYKEVREFAPEPEMDPRLPKRVWYARHIGVIKKELYNGQVWELKEYYIP